MISASLWQFSCKGDSVVVEDTGVVIGTVICEDGGSVVVLWPVVHVVDVDVEVVFDSGTAELGMYGIVMVVVSNSPIYTKVRKHLFVKGILFKKKSLKYLIQPTFRGGKAQA